MKKKNMAPHTVHNVRFYSPHPRAAHTMDYSVDLHLLALSREDGTIEIWNFSSKAPFLQSSIPPLLGELERSVEALSWVPDGRLFSTGLHGFVHQHYGSKKAGWPVTSGAVWCMKYNVKNQKLALGTEEGFVCLFDVSKDGLDYDKVLDKQEGRVLSLDWHKNGQHVVSGSTDTLRVWDVQTGHPLVRMSTGRSERHLETTVWSVLFLDDFTVVSGDSRGKTSFWNGKNGTLLDSYQSHKADILTVACNGDDQNVVFSSGIDPVIMHFQPVLKGENKKKWVKSIHRWANTHDVHSILSLKGTNKVLSVGVDANLAVNDVKTKNLDQFPPFAWGQNVLVAEKAAVVALRYTSSIELWTLGQAQKPTKNMSEEQLTLVKEPVKLLEMLTKDGDTIHNMHVSSDAKWMGYVTSSKLRVYKLSIEQPFLVQRVGIKCGGEIMPHIMRFCGEDRLLTATSNGTLSYYNLCPDTLKASLIWSLESSQKLELKSGIAQVTVDKAGNFCAVSDYNSDVVVYDVVNEKVVSKLPKYDDAPLTCFEIHPRTENIVLCYADHHFVECHAKTGKYTKLTSLLFDLYDQLPSEWRDKRCATKGILFPQSHLSGINSKKHDTIMFYDEQNICVLDRHAVTEASEASQNVPTGRKVAKKFTNSPKKATTAAAAEKQIAPMMRINNRYQHLVYLGTLAPENDQDNACPIVAVEVKPSSLEAKLPASLRQKKFGAM